MTEKQNFLEVDSKSQLLYGAKTGIIRKKHDSMINATEISVKRMVLRKIELNWAYNGIRPKRGRNGK